MKTYKEQIAALCEFPIKELQNYMVDSMGYGTDDLEDWPDKEDIAEIIVSYSNTEEALAYMSPAPPKIFPWPLIRYDKYIMVKPANSGAYNVAIMDNEHLIPVDAYANLFIASPDLLEALKGLLKHACKLSNSAHDGDSEIFAQAREAIRKAEEGK